MHKNHSQKPRICPQRAVASALRVAEALETVLRELSRELMAQQEVENPALLTGTASGQ